MQDVNIEVIGIERLTERLDNLEKRTKNLKPLYNDIALHLYSIVEESFENESSPDGIKWNPIKFRKNDLHPEKILYDSGDLQGKLYSQATATSATVGINAINNDFQYPLTHQFGTSKAGRNRNITIDERPFMPIKNDGTLYDGVEDELIEIVRDYFSFQS